MTDEPIKILPFKTYNRIGHLSTSRLGEGDHFVDKRTEETCLRSVPDNQTLVIVQEKLDGSNVAVANVGGRIVPITRSGYDCAQSNLEQHVCFARWVELRASTFHAFLQPGMRIVGEWLMQAHGTKYDLRQYSPFVAFDLFNEANERFSYHEFLLRVSPYHQIPLMLHMGGSCSILRAAKLLTGNPAQPYRTSDGYEGFIYRIEKAGTPTTIVKHVFHDKVDGRYFADGVVWNITPMELFHEVVDGR